MSNQWEAEDRLVITRDCELGAKGEAVRVVSVDGPYMTVSVGNDGSRIRHTGRDYRFVVRSDRSASDRGVSRDAAIGQILELLRSHIAILSAPCRQEARELARDHGITALDLLTCAHALARKT